MKKAYPILLACFVLPLLLLSVSAAAQGVNPQGIVLDKWVEKTSSQGKYRLVLDAYVTGSSSQTITKIHIPADIVLVLDLSGSMSDGMPSDTYTARSVMNYTYEIYGNNKYYYKDGDDYYLVSRKTWEANDKTYYAMTYEKDGTTYYLNYTYGPQTKPTTFSGISNVLYRGVLYTNTIQKITALKNAVNNFIDVIAEDAHANNVDNMISIVKYANGYYDSESSIEEGNHRTGETTGANYTEVVKNLLSANSTENVRILKDAVSSLAAYGATFAEYGIKKASYVLDKDNPRYIESTGKKPRNKVVVMFTDGEPTHSSGFTESVANAAVSNAKDLKDSGVTVYAIGVFSEDKDNVEDYMNRVSSNYPNTTTYQNGKKRTDGKNYYMKASKPDELNEIFQDIAEASVSGSASVEIGSSSTTVIDILNKDFRIPSEVSINDIKIQTIAATGGAGTTASPFTFDEENPQILACRIVIGRDDQGNDKISVSNFDFSLDDVWTEDMTGIVTFGNWVGPRVYGSPKQTVVKGKKLRISFPIELKPNYAGGYDDLTNKSESGIYSQDLDYPIARFPIPHLDYPSMAIVKSGLQKGESAVFTVQRTGKLKTNTNGDIAYDAQGRPEIVSITKSAPFSVTLTGVDESGSDVHAVLKDIPEGLYKITEQSWSWAYDVTSPSSVPYIEKILCRQTMDEDFSGSEFGGILYDGIKCVTVKFGNTSKEDMPDHAEAVVTNDFKKGTATTANSKTQPVTSQ